MKLSDWIIIDEDCATKVIFGTDPSKVENRVAFIERSPRVRVKAFTEVDDFENWEFGNKGDDYGMDEESRKWCDEKLIKLGYKL